jgi:hypothetical protein
VSKHTQTHRTIKKKKRTQEKKSENLNCCQWRKESKVLDANKLSGLVCLSIHHKMI